VKILAWPRESTSNPIFGVVNQSLSDTYGTAVEQFTAGRLISGKFDVWHVQFPETVLYHGSVWRALPRVVTLRLLVTWARLCGIKLLWTANNLGSHERNHPRLERWLWAFFLSRVDAFVAHSESGAAVAREHHAGLQDKRHFVVPEPHFRSVRYDDVDREEARERLGMPQSAKVALFVGRIRPYKCIEHLISVFRNCCDEDLRLIIAGRPHTSDLARRLEERAGKERRIKLVLGHVPEKDLQFYLNGSDVVVLPYREIFLSGTALLALSYDRPILVPRRGALGELAEEVGPAWVRLYDGDLTPDELIAAMGWARAPRSTRPDLRRHDLDQVTAALQRAYDALVA
jgi:glycosyltransferase involved in cell wall biosynthesis